MNKTNVFCSTYYIMTCEYINDISIVAIFSKIKYYLTPATACASNVFPHPGGP